jgi:dipeptide/tripeptide permease
MKFHKLLATAQAIGGVLIALTPIVLPVCRELLETKAGTFVPMRCHYTAQAEIAMGILVTIVGALVLIFASQAETRGALNAVVITLGAVVILIPTFLIGTCKNPEMPCNVGTKPALILLGATTMLLGAIGLWDAWRSGKPATPAVAG